MLFFVLSYIKNKLMIIQ